jgi:hypothetical protein
MMDKPVAHGAMAFTPGSCLPIKEDTTSACHPPSPIVSNQTIFISYDVSPDQDAIFGSAGPYDDDGESPADEDRD